MNGLVAFFKKYAIQWMFWQALIATMASLYLWYFGDPVSNIIGWTPFDFSLWYPPCDLCRFARILMYPLVLFLGYALRRKDKNIVPYMIVPVVLGIGLEVFHYVIQKVNTWLDITCSAVNPCDGMYVNYLWFVTIPFLCLLAFVVIALFIAIFYSKNKTLTTVYTCLIIVVWLLVLVSLVHEYMLFIG